MCSATPSIGLSDISAVPGQNGAYFNPLYSSSWPEYFNPLYSSASLGSHTTCCTHLPPLPPGQKYHSVVLRPQRPVSDTCVFTAYRTADSRSIEPEVYPRPDGSVYVCGEPAAVPVPPDGPAGVSLEKALLQVLKVGRYCCGVLGVWGA